MLNCVCAAQVVKLAAARGANPKRRQRIPTYLRFRLPARSCTCVRCAGVGVLPPPYTLFGVDASGRSACLCSHLHPLLLAYNLRAQVHPRRAAVGANRPRHRQAKLGACKMKLMTYMPIHVGSEAVCTCGAASIGIVTMLPADTKPASRMILAGAQIGTCAMTYHALREWYRSAGRPGL
jgi:hypothetical protein